MIIIALAGQSTSIPPADRKCIQDVINLIDNDETCNKLPICIHICKVEGVLPSKLINVFSLLGLLRRVQVGVWRIPINALHASLATSKGQGIHLLTKQRDWEMIKSRSEFYPSLWADFLTRHRKFYAGTDYEPNFRMKYKSSCGK
jgi:hypothetical protein